MVRILGATPGGDQDVGRRNFPNPVWAAGPGLHGFFQAPAAYRLAIANDRDRALAPLEGPMVPLDPPSPDLTYDRRRDNEERMDRKRARYLRPQAPAAAPISRFVLENILRESATAMEYFPMSSRGLLCRVACITAWRLSTRAGTVGTRPQKEV